MKTTDLIKNFDGHDVRVVGTPENPLFVAADVCAVLGLNNVSMALEPLDADEKITISNADGNPRAGIPHQFLAVTESGLYHLIFKSRKESAKRFRRWVTEEVLPAIRRDGLYLPTAPPTEDIGARADKISCKLLFTLDQLIRRGVPPQAAAGCVSNVFKDSVRIPSAYPQVASPETLTLANS